MRPFGSGTRVAPLTDMRPWSVLPAVALAALCCVVNTPAAYPDAVLRQQDFRTKFFTKPITDAARADILENGARELQRSDFAALVLFLDKNRQVWQVNMSYVVPGTTVARTVAWKPQDLRQFSNYKFDGKRLLLKSKGFYSESGEEQLKLSWEVDLNLPVFEPIKK